ncbi:hypothetical protein [Rhizobium leguminosarum]|nr:hypothetical protein [Rhizobium leguminosarum]
MDRLLCVENLARDLCQPAGEAGFEILYAARWQVDEPMHMQTAARILD